MCKIKNEVAHNLQIWSYLNAQVSTEVYHVYQEWNDFSISSKKKTERNYSFLGLYRKFSEADVHDLIDISKKK